MLLVVVMRVSMKIKAHHPASHLRGSRIGLQPIMSGVLAGNLIWTVVKTLIGVVEKVLSTRHPSVCQGVRRPKLMNNCSQEQQLAENMNSVNKPGKVISEAVL